MPAQQKQLSDTETELRPSSSQRPYLVLTCSPPSPTGIFGYLPGLCRHLHTDVKILLFLLHLLEAL